MDDLSADDPDMMYLPIKRPKNSWEHVVDRPAVIKADPPTNMVVKYHQHPSINDSAGHKDNHRLSLQTPAEEEGHAQQQRLLTMVVLQCLVPLFRCCAQFSCPVFRLCYLSQEVCNMIKYVSCRTCCVQACRVRDVHI